MKLRSCLIVLALLLPSSQTLQLRTNSLLYEPPPASATSVAVSELKQYARDHLNKAVPEVDQLREVQAYFKKQFDHLGQSEKEAILANVVKAVKTDAKTHKMDDVLLQTDIPLLGIGDLLRWIKCVFKDCAVEDAKRDHESAERERAEEKQKKEEEDRRAQAERKEKEQKEEEEKAAAQKQQEEQERKDKEEGEVLAKKKKEKSEADKKEKQQDDNDNNQLIQKKSQPMALSNQTPKNPPTSGDTQHLQKQDDHHNGNQGSGVLKAPQAPEHHDLLKDHNGNSANQTKKEKVAMASAKENSTTMAGSSAKQDSLATSPQPNKTKVATKQSLAASRHIENSSQKSEASAHMAVPNRAMATKANKTKSSSASELVTKKMEPIQIGNQSCLAKVAENPKNEMKAKNTEKPKPPPPAEKQQGHVQNSQSKNGTSVEALSSRKAKEQPKPQELHSIHQEPKPKKEEHSLKIETKRELIKARDNNTKPKEKQPKESGFEKKIEAPKNSSVQKVHLAENRGASNASAAAKISSKPAQHDVALKKRITQEQKVTRENSTLKQSAFSKTSKRKAAAPQPKNELTLHRQPNISSTAAVKKADEVTVIFRKGKMSMSISQPPPAETPPKSSAAPKKESNQSLLSQFLTGLKTNYQEYSQHQAEYVSDHLSEPQPEASSYQGEPIGEAMAKINSKKQSGEAGTPKNKLPAHAEVESEPTGVTMKPLADISQQPPTQSLPEKVDQGSQAAQGLQQMSEPLDSALSKEDRPTSIRDSNNDAGVQKLIAAQPQGIEARSPKLDTQAPSLSSQTKDSQEDSRPKSLDDEVMKQLNSENFYDVEGTGGATMKQLVDSEVANAKRASIQAHPEVTVKVGPSLAAVAAVSEPERQEPVAANDLMFEAASSTFA